MSKNKENNNEKKNKKSIQIFSNQQFLIRYHIKQKRATFWSLFSFGIKDYLSSKEINFFLKIHLVVELYRSSA